MKNAITVAALAVFSGSDLSRAESLSATPQQDNTLYESVDGSLSNGAGGSIFAGVTNTGDLRRAVLRFDLSDIPHGSFVTGATLRITKDRQGPGGAPSLAVHRVIASWGEGTSSGSGGGGIAATGDATWLHRSFPGTLWASPGGDFDATVLSSLTASATGNQTFASSPDFVGAVQSWVSGPQFNFGLMIKETAPTAGAAARFYSREATDAVVRPALTVSFDRPTHNWTSDANGDWNDAGNWNLGVPDAFGRIARFAGTISAPRTVTNGSAVRVGQLEFDSPQSYTLAGAGQITLDNGNSFAARIDVLSGSHVVPVRIETNRPTVLTVAAAASLHLGAFAALSQIAKTGGGVVRLTAGHIDSLTVSGGQIVLDSNVASDFGSLTLSGGAVDAARSGAMQLSTASAIAADFAARSANILAGSIFTSEAGLTVGIARSDELAAESFMGRSVATPSVLFRATFAGDTNLDSFVNFDDLLKLAQSYGTPTGARWIDGDSNRDGKVDFDDLLALAQKYGSSFSREGHVTVDASVHEAFASEWQRALVIVPEPTLAFLVLAVSPCLRRRR